MRRRVFLKRGDKLMSAIGIPGILGTRKCLQLASHSVIGRRSYRQLCHMVAICKSAISGSWLTTSLEVRLLLEVLLCRGILRIRNCIYTEYS